MHQVTEIMSQCLCAVQTWQSDQFITWIEGNLKSKILSVCPVNELSYVPHSFCYIILK